MQGYLSLVLHAHLPFVRHPEHEKFLEENWLFEAITETYVPLLQVIERWERDGMQSRLTLTLTPTLCAMLLDPLLQDRYVRHLNELIELAENETHRTHWDKPFNELARFYHRRFIGIRDTYFSYGRNLVGGFRKYQDLGRLEIITSAATHALLPLLANHPPSIRAQILVARDHYRSCFGRDPRGIWLPECAYVDGVENVLQEANLRWFITDTHGVLHARPRPRYGVFAPIFTPNGIAAFGRDLDSAKQVWSKHEGYPGDVNYRDFYRDIGFDLDFDYVKRYLPATDHRGFTGIKYFRITGGSDEKIPYDRVAALQTAANHAQHFLEARMGQIGHLAGILDRPPLVLSPYDAELFGHWWYEGPEFLDYFMRKAYYDQRTFELITPEEYLRRHPTNQVARPSASSWGEEGYWRVWLNETNEWIYPHLHVAQERMTQLARNFPAPDPLRRRALNQAARELLLAQASDWPFILRTGTSPDYARKRVKDHLLRFIALHDQLTSTGVDEQWLGQAEWRDNIFPEINYRYWA
jgi:1,4-alpha-glucan branching enzyme